jgi:thymidylate synthase (FAD)
MTDIQFRSNPSVDLVQSMGTDASVVFAARVSVVAEAAQQYEEADAVEHRGLINYLMSHRHGTPFEHATMTFRIEAPIFVFREFHRHRVGWSYNEASGRYSQLAPVFHLPAFDRPLVNVGTSARPVMAPGTTEQWESLVERMQESYRSSYQVYLDGLEAGVAKEVAREVLPVGIYSTMYATCNMRSLMHFLSLRVEDESATFVSHPQYEIQQVALAMEDIFASTWPITYDCWIKNGRVAP